MLRTKSFKISDSDGVNKLLDEYRLAPGAGIFVSNGEVMIPYEDGKPQNKAQKTIELREQQNKMRGEMDVIEHSNRVMDHLLADAQDRINVARAALEDAETNPKKGKDAQVAVNHAKAKVHEAEDAHAQLLNQVKLNQHELVRLQVNIDEFEASIAKL